MTERPKRHICAGLLAHVDAGKTTITEQLLLVGGGIRTAGSVDDGTARTDWLEVERRRGISVKTACAQIQFGEDRITLVDTPGHMDFAGEVARCLEALDGAVLVISGAEGVQAHTKTIFAALRRLKIPMIIVVNKVDRAGFDRGAVLAQIQRELTDRLICLQEVRSPACEACEIVPATLRPEKLAADGWSDPLLERLWMPVFEKLADLDEELEEMYLEERRPAFASLQEKAVRLARKGEICPVVFASARAGKGIRALAEAMVTYLPDSSARRTKELSGIVFQMTHDPVMGKAVHVRLFGGSLESRDVVPIVGQAKEEWEKATQIRKIQGGKFLDVGRIEEGEVAAVYGLTKCRVGDRIGIAKQRNAEPGDTGNRGGAPSNPLGIEALLLVQVRPKDPAKEIELAAALTELSEEDPMLQYERNPLTRQMYLRVMGTVQIEILQELLQTRFGLATVFSSPSVVYKETPGHIATGCEVYTMPKPCWAIVNLQIEPLPPGSGLVFESVIKEKQLPYRYQNHVRSSLFETFRQGIYGWEVTDAKVTLVGGEHHHVHTHPLDFFVATPVAALRALTASDAVLLEPYMKLTLSGREELIGKVLGDILAMRGEFSSPVLWQGNFTLEAVAPLRDCMDYPTEFHSLTSGRGSCSMRPDSYRPCEKGFVERLPRRGVDPLDHAKWILSCRSAY